MQELIKHKSDLFITFNTINEALEYAMNVSNNCSNKDKPAVITAFMALINTICKVEADKCQVG